MQSWLSTFGGAKADMKMWKCGNKNLFVFPTMQRRTENYISKNCIFFLKINPTPDRDRKYSLNYGNGE